ncbi:protein ROOT PRIMORDIUM DEFECTIVE 1 [Phalaenopsis equestris]|uniref:protein ROOT PRIMORDIUM DEFECTIVE 1 n=1 Tax=Phalaenopsis equestris TaxID=78828 RepID=UPI0009E3AE2A|nr:protein ROOT PRIMORDIUM DEFECTIVE 1 [Phalaenopsis equestris]XP_020582194.1 protein ROOT PRIMORDIUM DEFECTIVE 1 [Phalaenopsis equestris]
MSPFSISRARLLFSFSLSIVRYQSQSTSIPKKLQRVRDHSFDNLMEVEKKVRRALKLQDLILSHPGGTLPVSLLESLARRHLRFSPQESSSFLLRHPHVFHVFEHPVQRVLHARLTPRALHQLRLESEALSSSLPSAALRLRRFVLLAAPSFRIRLEHIRLARTDLGLPEDFEQSIVLSHPSLFRLLSPSGPDAEPRLKFVEAVLNPDEPFPIAAVELAREREYRERGSDAEDARFAFPIQFPPGFKIGKYYRVAVWKWQRLPYWSPYEDVSGYDLRSLEAQRRMEKRAVATIHEFLSLTVEKRTTLERIANFRQAMGLPKKLKEFLLQHQGIFYISTRGNQGKLHTVFLREGYRKGEILEQNDVYLARKRLRELLLISSKKANFDRMLTSLGRQGDGPQCVPALNRKEFFGDDDAIYGGDEEGSGSDSGVESQFIE